MNTQSRTRRVPLLSTKPATRIAAISMMALLPGILTAQTNTTFDITGAVNTFPTQINNAGTVAGYYTDTTVLNGYHGFIRQAGTGTITTFNPPSDSARGTVVLWGMNNLGTTVGTYTKGSIQTGFMRDSAGNFTDIAPAGATLVGVGISINDLGQIAGSWIDSALPSKSHGFIRDAAGNYTIFDIAGASSINIAKINNNGQVAGFYDDTALPRLRHGFLRDAKGGITVFEAPVAGAVIQVNSMNDSQEITGFYTTDNYTTIHGFVRTPKGSKIVSFDADAGKTQTFAFGINSVGAITGWACIGWGSCEGFVRNPPAHGPIVGTGTFTTFNVTGASNTQPNSINDTGGITGPWIDAPMVSPYPRHGFIRQ